MNLDREVNKIDQLRKKSESDLQKEIKKGVKSDKMIK